MQYVFLISSRAGCKNDVTRLCLMTYFLPPALERIKNTYCMDKRPFLYLYALVNPKSKQLIMRSRYCTVEDRHGRAASLRQLSFLLYVTSRAPGIIKISSRDVTVRRVRLSRGPPWLKQNSTFSAEPRPRQDDRGRPVTGVRTADFHRRQLP